MTKITTIPTSELHDDLAGARYDLAAHEKLHAISSDKRLVEWIEQGRAIIQEIEEELKRREDRNED
jgi:hypothetical protein